jgi:four helix bundle protein
MTGRLGNWSGKLARKFSMNFKRSAIFRISIESGICKMLLKMDFKQLEERLIKFAVLAVNVVNQLPDDRLGLHLGGQLMRSGTSPALNYGEALGAETRKDFIHKLGIVLKELRETHNCLKILSRTQHIADNDPALVECNELISIFVTSIRTAKKNAQP